MEIKVMKPKKALNKAFLKVKPNRTEIERFKTLSRKNVKDTMLSNQTPSQI